MRTVGPILSCHSFTPQYSVPSYSNPNAAPARFRAQGVQTQEMSPVDLRNTENTGKLRESRYPSDCASYSPYTAHEGWFLMAGQSPVLVPQTVAIQTTIPCQYGDALLKFDAWASSDRPVVRKCIIQEKFGMTCQEVQTGPNPLNFTIPHSEVPITVRIEITNISSEDLVVIDNLYYEGQICELISEGEISARETIDQSTSEMNSLGLQKINDNEIVSSPRPLFSMKIHKAGEDGMVVSTSTSDSVTSVADYEKDLSTVYPENHNLISTSQPEEVTKPDENTEEPTSFPIVHSEETSSEHFNTRQAPTFPTLTSSGDEITDPSVMEITPCDALTCNFNEEHPCFYGLSGIGSTSPWIHANKLIGNRHTGIQRINIGDLDRVGFVFVGKNHIDQSLDMFVMESPKFTLQSNLFLVFDVYIRSVGPKLKVILIYPHFNITLACIPHPVSAQV
ncbi:hypothetical protein WR25_17351 [Diploscapter pachys]|uniref:MAM domain-containing protein n=1 Tax=Diploscapter pachys TaxID=2018661 RepID=A0A2A2JN53_9BILA|nr:hypothetical protein WR25_17351 [Diploscapter pachys]